MSQKIQFAKSNIPDDKKIIMCNELDKNEYETKYKGKLTCIKDCKARIKFTERKDNTKFFSTWNKEGHLHNEDCPYYVEYKGVKGRAKLKAFYSLVQPSDDVIYNRLLAKAHQLDNKYNESDINHPDRGSSNINTNSKNTVDVNIDGGNEESSRFNNIKHEDANYITKDDVGCRKSVYGHINNVQLQKDMNGKSYAYFNLESKNTMVNIMFPEAFYSNEFSNGVDEFEKFIKNVRQKVEQNPKEIMVIAYGEIRSKMKNINGVNVSVISPRHIVVDKKPYGRYL